MRRDWNWLGALIVMALFAGEASALPAEYEVTLVKSGGGWIAFGLEINAHGEIIGWTTGYPGTAWTWEGGQTTTLPLVYPSSEYSGVAAYGINDLGQAVGRAVDRDGVRHACLWSGGTVTDLGALGAGESRALAINNAGWVVGETTVQDGHTHAFLWKDGVMTDLGTLGGTTSAAHAINSHGQIVGETTDAAGNRHGFLWQNGTMTDLGTLGGSWSRANDINDLGQIIGESADAAGIMRAVLWDDGDIVQLTDGTRDMISGINNLGQIVGHSDGGGGPFLLEDGVKTNLETFTGADLSSAIDINDRGQIIVAGGAFSRSVYLLTPVPEPTCLSLLAIGALATIRRRRKVRPRGSR